MEKRKYGYGAYASSGDVFQKIPRRLDKDEIYEANERIGLGAEYVKFKRTGKI